MVSNRQLTISLSAVQSFCGCSFRFEATSQGSVHARFIGTPESKQIVATGCCEKSHLTFCRSSDKKSAIKKPVAFFAGCFRN